MTLKTGVVILCAAVDGPDGTSECDACAPSCGHSVSWSRRVCCLPFARPRGAAADALLRHFHCQGQGGHVTQRRTHPALSTADPSSGRVALPAIFSGFSQAPGFSVAPLTEGCRVQRVQFSERRNARASRYTSGCKNEIPQRKRSQVRQLAMCNRFVLRHRSLVSVERGYRSVEHVACGFKGVNLCCM